MELYKNFTIDAAHYLPNVPQGHKCGRLHGHTFSIEIHVKGNVDAHSGWVIDYGDIKKYFKPVQEALDHRYLNEIAGLENPTSENIAKWIWARLKPSLPLLHRVVVHETPTVGCAYLGE